MSYRRFLVPSLFAVALVAPPLASAHVTIDPAQAPAGSYVRATLRVAHGCKGSPTVRIRARIPEGCYRSSRR